MSCATNIRARSCRPVKPPPATCGSLTEEGAAERWPRGVPAAVRAQIERELALIAELGYEPFFLTVYDIAAFARSAGILHQGRGSAANSLVCYCLKVTAVGPEQLSMLFERFVSRERDEPPDIDIDFEHERREEVIQYIYSKYGRERAALAATVITYQVRSAVRDLARALDVDETTQRRLIMGLRGWHGHLAEPEKLRAAGVDPDSEPVATLLKLAATLVGFPRHLSQHVGGFVISEGPLSQLVPVENATMPERTVIQWDKDDLEDLRLLKVDVLGLGMLTAIRRCFDLVARVTAGRRCASTPSPGRRGGVRHDLPRRHHRRVPDRVARADVDAAAPAAAQLLRPGDRGGHRPARAHPGRHGASLPAPPQRRRAGGAIPARRCAACWRAPAACPSSRNR